MKTAAELIAFENRIRDHFAAGELPCLVHLSGGNEEQLIEIFREIRPGDYVFSGHRSHYHALLKGIPAWRVENDILTGKSMFIFSREHRFFTSSILGGCCGIAAGVAAEIKRGGHTERIWCFLGDGACDEGAFWEALNFVEGQNLPCTFVIEDNDRQVDTDKATRRGSDIVDWVLGNYGCVRRYTYTPTYPHGGAGLPPGSVTFKPEAIARLSNLKS